jgi:predicted methyltransferase MtxX (methanogen marker protein 4)
MPFYTVIARHNGEEYIDQIRGRTVRAAIAAWAKATNIKNISGLTVRHERLLIAEIADPENPCIAVEGVKNTWRMSALIKRKLVLITAVRTDEGVSL